MSNKLEEGALQKVKKFLKKHTNKGKFEKASVRAMQAPTVKGWANRQARINALKEDEFNSEEFIDFLLAEGHTEEEIEKFLDEEFEQFLTEELSEEVELDEQITDPPKKGWFARRKELKGKIARHGKLADNKAKDHAKQGWIHDKEGRSSSANVEFKRSENQEKIKAGADKKTKSLSSTKNYMKGKKKVNEEAEPVEEGIVTTIKNRLSGKREDTVTKAMRGALRTGAKSMKYNSASITAANKSSAASLKGDRTAAKDHYEQSVHAGKMGDGFLAANKSLTRKMHDVSVGKNYFKGKKVNEEFDVEGLTEENLMEIKMKLKPGQKMSAKAFAKAKAEVLAKQKAKAEKKAAPKVEPKEEPIENDDNNRGARILKGQFPWGRVTPELAKTALAKLKMIEKPADRLQAMNHIWDKQEHFHTLIKTGKVNAGAKKEDAPKSKITLAKVRGVND